MGEQANLDVELQDGNDVQEDYCPIGDMPRTWCAHCKGLKTPEEEELHNKKVEQDFLRSME